MASNENATKLKMIFRQIDFDKAEGRGTQTEKKKIVYSHQISFVANFKHNISVILLCATKSHSCGSGCVAVVDPPEIDKELLDK